MKKTKKVVIALTALTVAATILSGCSSNGNSTVNSNTEKIQQALTKTSDKASNGNVITADEQKYLDLVQKDLSGMDESFTKIGELLSRIEERDTKEWQDEYAKAAAVILVYNEDMKKRTPPQRLQEVHKYFTEALQHSDDGVMALTASFDNSDTAKADTAVELFKQAKLSLAWVNIEIARFKEGKQ